MPSSGPMPAFSRSLSAATNFDGRVPSRRPAPASVLAATAAVAGVLAALASSTAAVVVHASPIVALPSLPNLRGRAGGDVARSRAARAHGSGLAAAIPGAVPQDSGSNEEEERSEESQTRIVGGTLAPPGLYPYFVQGPRCAGTLIAKDVVLSAAHCAEDFVGTVIVGSTEYDSVKDGSQSRRITSDMYLHPKYGSLAYDYMLFKIEPVTEPNLVPASLNVDSCNPAENEVVTAVGFGVTENGQDSHYLRHVALNAVRGGTCASQIAALVSDVGIIDEVMLCAGIEGEGYDPCIGDGGGPLLSSSGALVGVMSWGIGCNAPDSPRVFSRVSGEIDWIRSTACAISADPPAFCEKDESSGGSDEGESEADDPTLAPSSSPAPSVGSMNSSAPTASPAPTYSSTPTPDDDEDDVDEDDDLADDDIDIDDDDDGM